MQLPPVSTAQEYQPQQLPQLLMFHMLENHLAQQEQTLLVKSSLKRFQYLTVLKLLPSTLKRLPMELKLTIALHYQMVQLHHTPNPKLTPLFLMEKPEPLFTKPYPMVNIKPSINTPPLAMDQRLLIKPSTPHLELHLLRNLLTLTQLVNSSHITPPPIPMERKPPQPPPQLLFQNQLTPRPIHKVT